MTEIIAHRGASRDCPENTMEAFARALALGADALELDVHATRDGTIVVHHDPTVAMDDLAAGRRPEIAGLSVTQIDALHVRGAHRIPHLDAVFDLVGARATVYVEVKGVGIEDALVACLNRHPQARLAVHAFDHRIPVGIRRRRPGTAIGLLSASYPLDVAAMIPPEGADSLWQEATLIDADFVDAAHTAGARLIAWTVNDAERARALVALGVDALCTDIPDVIRAALRE
jgi:glycerophosphoryl diester phosphodiesterase